MAHSVLHHYVNPQIDDGDPNVTGPDEWNAQHDIIIDASAIDHGGLSGLGDNDHPQYFLVANAQALTRVNDTNVTLTLGGTPATALLQAVSLTLGWSGQLGVSRGGTGADLSSTGGTGYYVKQDGVGVPLTVGTIANVDLPGNFSGFANPTASVGLAAVNGSSAFAMRADAAPALDQTIAPTWSGIHLFSNNVRMGSYLRVGSTSAATNTTAGDLTAARLFIPDGALVSGVRKVQVTETWDPGSANDYTVYIAPTGTPGASTDGAYGIYVKMRVQPTASNSSGQWNAIVAEAFHDSSAQAISGLAGVVGAASQQVGSSTLTQSHGGYFYSSATGGTITTARGLYGLVDAQGGTITTGIGVEIDRNRTTGTFTTAIGLRINAATGTIGTDIAIQSLSGHHRFVGQVKIGADSTPAVALDVTGNERISGYSQIGSSSAPSNTTAGDLTAIRAHFGTDAAFDSFANAAEVYFAGSTTANPDAFFHNAALLVYNKAAQADVSNAVAVDHSSTAISAVSRPVIGSTGVGSSTILRAMDVYYQRTSGSATVPVAEGMRVYASEGTSGSVTTTLRAIHATVQLESSGGTITNGIGVDIERTRQGGTFTTAVGLRVRAASGTVTNDIAIQSQGGENRFVGNTIIGNDASPAVELVLYASGGTPRFHLQNASTGTTSGDGFQIAVSTLDAYVWNFENAPLHFATNNTERVTITAAGVFQTSSTVSLGALSGPTAGVCVQISGSSGHGIYVATATAVDGVSGILNQPAYTPTANVGGYYGQFNQAALNTNGKAVTNFISTFERVYITTGTTGSIGTIYNYWCAAPVYDASVPKPGTVYGILVDNMGVSGVSNAIGIHISAQSGATNNWDMSFGRVDTSAAGAYYGKIPVLYNGLTKYIHVFS